jgi:hypothetical protein
MFLQDYRMWTLCGQPQKTGDNPGETFRKNPGNAASGIKTGAYDLPVFKECPKTIVGRFQSRSWTTCGQAREASVALSDGPDFR